LGIDEVESLECRVDDRHHVFVVAGSPTWAGVVQRAANRAAVLLGIAGAAARIREEHCVAASRVDLVLVEEARSVLRERAAMDVQQGRVAPAGLEAGGPYDPGVDLISVRRDRGEALGLDE